MDNDWHSNLIRTFIAAFAIAVLTLFAIAIRRQLPNDPASDESRPGAPIPNLPSGETPGQGGATSRFTSSTALRACWF
jgi:hypothetical protein